MSITWRARTAQLLAVLGVAGFSALPAPACTRALYVGLNGRVLTGRTMDWKDDIQTNLWILPRGVARDGAAGSTSLRIPGGDAFLTVRCERRQRHRRMDRRQDADPS